MKYNFLGDTVLDFDRIQNIGDTVLMKAKSKDFTTFLKEAKEVVKKIAENEKVSNKKEVVKWHTKLDELLHDFVGKEGLTVKEKKGD